MRATPILERVMLIALVTVALWAVGASRASAQTCDGPCPPPCPVGQVCTPFPCDEQGSCTTETAIFTPTMDTWTYVFDGNNAIKIGTDVHDTFVLKVDMIRISQLEYAARRDNSQFADSVCNPSFGVGTDCVFYRVHGETVLRTSYGTTVDYKIFWNLPAMQGNKHDWMLLRAPCEEFAGDTNFCDDSQKFNEEITNFVDRRPPVGTDPVVGGDADGMSDYIVAISTRHPHTGINR